MLLVLGNLNTQSELTELQFADGRILRLPTAMLEAQQAAGPNVDTASQASDIILPLIEEQLEVTKRAVTTGKVRLEKTVETFDVTLDERLAVNSWKVQRVPVGRVVQSAPPVRGRRFDHDLPHL